MRYAGSNTNSPVSIYLRPRNIVLISVAALMIFLWGCCGIRTVGAGRTGVVRTFGNVHDKELHSGIHWLFPFWKNVDSMSIRIEEYTMAAATNEGDKVGDDSISARSSEGNIIGLDMTVLHRLVEDKASDVYKELGPNYVDTILRPTIRTAIRTTISKYTTAEVYSSKREIVEDELQLTIATAVEPRGVVIEKTLLRNVSLPGELDKSIESKLVAEQDALKMVFVLQQAEQEAVRRGTEAKGIKNAQTIIDASLTEEYLRWYSIEMMRELAGSPNTTFLFVPTDKSGMPIVNISK